MRATALIAPHGGEIVEEFFDAGLSRSVPWKRRPQANRLLDALKDPARGFDAVVIGEPHRAFYGNQFGNTFPLFTHFGVPLWVPEVGGAVDADNEAHDVIMSVFAGMSKGERTRIKLRVRTSMAAQTKIEGRFLGGRPPYGYAIVALGPHPNPSKAADGRMLHGLDPDPIAAVVVQRIFAEYLAGLGLFAIAEGLTRDGIPCPSAHDPARNPHRIGIAWAKSAVRVILTNPRYTGRQVWNKQRKDEVLLDTDDVTMGHIGVMRWNPKDKWITSDELVHAPLIDDDTFQAAQDLLASRGRGPKEHATHRAKRHYTLRGALMCGLCDRKMQGQWNHDKPYYRCRFPEEYALANHVHHPRNIYLREADVLLPLDAWLARAFAPHRLESTIDALLQATPAHTDDGADIERARRQVKECDTKLARYQAALDAGGDPAAIAQWTNEVRAQRTQAQARLRTVPRSTAPSKATIRKMITGLGDMAKVIQNAALEDKAEVYRTLGIRGTYHPGTQKVRIEANLDPHLLTASSPRGEMVCVRGGT
ncbi:recombinase family protein [Kitasatospora sp. NBC_01539]|uniref:recombinase family protein n=1 Tax=Kitasatospora sp. NBC_01539 TaxID=2903577 RepID=UPI003860168F